MSQTDLVQIAAAAAVDKKATKILALDVRGLSDICDYTLICSGDNERQTQAICTSIEESCKSKLGTRPLGLEGKQSGQWILMDYGSLIVHIFLNPLRDYYAIEQLWPKAKSIPLPHAEPSS